MRIQKQSTEIATVRKATARDLVDIVTLWREYIDHIAIVEPFLLNSSLSSKYFREFLNDHFDDSNCRVVIASVKNTTIGFGIAVIREYWPMYKVLRYGYIQDLYVADNHRRNGIGARLLDEIRAWLVERTVTRIELDVTHVNHEGRTFWQHMGFHEFATRMERGV